MAFNEALAGRIGKRLARHKNVEEKKMFGGIGFLLNGNLLWALGRTGCSSGSARSRATRHEGSPRQRVQDHGPGHDEGVDMVGLEGVENDDQLTDWIQRAMKFVGAAGEGAACTMNGPGEKVNQRPNRHGPWPLEGRPPPGHPRCQIDARKDNAEQYEADTKEPHQGTVAIQIRRHHQAKSADQSVEGREGAGQVLHNWAGWHLAQPQPSDA